MLTRINLINTWLKMIQMFGLSLGFRDKADSRKMFNNLSMISNEIYMH